MTHSDINKVKVISELPCTRHSYVNLDCFNSEDIDFMIQFMCRLGLAHVFFVFYFLFFIFYFFLSIFDNFDFVCVCV